MSYLERSAYTFFMLVGDLGGFAGAMMLMPTWFMSWYSARVFQADVMGQISHKRPKRKREDNKKIGIKSGDSLDL